MYVSAADNDYVGVTGTFLGTPSQGVWSTARLDFSVPPGGIASCTFGGSIPGLVQQPAGTLDLYSMQITRYVAADHDTPPLVAVEVQSIVSVAPVTPRWLRSSLQLLRLRPSACPDTLPTVVKFPALAVLLTVRVLPVIPVAELSRPTLAAPLMLSELPDTAVDVSVAPATGAAQETAREASTPVVNTSVQFTSLHSSWSQPTLPCAVSPSRVAEPVRASESASRDSLLGHGLRAVALRVQHAHRDQHLQLLGRSLLDEELAGASCKCPTTAASDSGPELQLLGNQSARVFLERDGGTHQCELIMINNEALVQTKSLSTQLSL